MFQLRKIPVGESQSGGIENKEWQEMRLNDPEVEELLLVSVFLCIGVWI
jgi:hypothetical protein